MHLSVTEYGTATLVENLKLEHEHTEKNFLGKLTVNLTGLHPSNGPHADMRDMLLGFSIDKTVSDALNPYMEAQDTQCILNRTPADTNTSGIIR